MVSLTNMGPGPGCCIRVRERWVGGVEERDLPALAVEAAQQWTGQFNPRRFDEAAALEIYTAAY